jgi:hypothetical protein
MRLGLELFIVFCGLALGQDSNPFKDKLWDASLAATLATSMSDAATSSYLIDVKHAGTELNPIINRVNGTNSMFGPKGYGVKLGAFGAMTALQYVVIKKFGTKYPWVSKVCSAVNFGSAVVFGVETTRNANYIRIQ